MSELLTEGPEFSELLVKHLENTLNGHTWDYFETTQNGDNVVGGVVFNLRVGLHMKRPIKAILAMGCFIKIKPFGVRDAYDRDHLKDIDPKRPDLCLYNNGRFWHPEGTTQKPTPYDWSILDAAVTVNQITEGKANHPLTAYKFGKLP